MLAPLKPLILCQPLVNIIKKKRKKNTRRGRLDQNPNQKKQNKKANRNENSGDYNDP